MAKTRRRYMVQIWRERIFNWADYAGPFDTRVEAREAADKLWQYKTRIVTVLTVLEEAPKM